MGLKVCSVPGCPRLQPESKCAEHRRQAERERGSSTQRGYGYAHQRERAAWLPKVLTGSVLCRRCDEPIKPTEPFDLGHPDADCPKPKAPEHVACNRATVGR